MADKQQIVKTWALSKVGCGYVWGSSGQTLTESVLSSLMKTYSSHIDESIVSKWMGKQVFDCASFVKNAMAQVGISLPSGASSQWNKGKWLVKGEIKDLPKDKVCILYKTGPEANPMQHTGIYLGDGNVVDARGSNQGVIKSKLSANKWTHYAIPVGLYDITNMEPEVEFIMYTATVIADNGSSVNMRMSADIKSDLLAKVPLGTKVNVMSEQGDWCQIEYSGKIGYMMAKFLKKQENASGGWYVRVRCEDEAQARKIVAAFKNAEAIEI